jgi:type I restriction enzyme S subunit
MYVEPELRFPEFKHLEGWKRGTLRDLLSETKRRNRDLRFGREDVLSVSGEFGCVNQIEHLGRSYAGVSVAEYHVVETGDVVYTKSPLKNSPYGIIKENKGKNGIVSTLYAVYRNTKDAHSAFIDHYFSSDYNLNNYLRPIVRKGAKNDMKVNNSDVLGGVVYFPSFKEQKKIADFLSSLDELIGAEKQKLEALRRFKKGLMREVFPIQGEALPMRRFPEFNDAPDWESSKLGDRVHFASGGTPSKSNSLYWNGTIPWISASSMYETYLLKSDLNITELAIRDGARLAKKGTLLVLVRGSMLYNRIPICIAKVDVAFNQDVKALTPDKDIDPEFLLRQLLAFEDRIAVEKTGIGAGKIETDELKGLDIFVPTPNEQKRIVALFSSLDDNIAAQTNRLVALQHHKKGLMQGLIPSLIGDEA